jgi:hypothetical protein
MVLTVEFLEILLVHVGVDLCVSRHDLLPQKGIVT